MKTTISTAAPEIERGAAPNIEVYQNFIACAVDRADDEVMKLAEKLAAERDPDAILAMQKTLKAARRKAKILEQFFDSIWPEDLLEFIDTIAEPGVRLDVQPIFDMIHDLIKALGLSRKDIKAMPNLFQSEASNE